MSERSDFTFKIIIYGDGGVGKTTLINRYMSGLFDDSSKMTIGVDFRIKRLKIDGNSVSLQIWDLAGEERFRALMPAYMSGADAGIFMYDVTRLSSLRNVTKWLDTLKNYLKSEDQDLAMIMVGGKLDLEGRRAFPKKDAEYIATMNKFNGLIECSAKTGYNVEEVFIKIAQIIIHGPG